MTDISLQVENGKIVAYDEQGNKVPVPAEAIATDQASINRNNSVERKTLANLYNAAVVGDDGIWYAVDSGNVYRTSNILDGFGLASNVGSEPTVNSIHLTGNGTLLTSIAGELVRSTDGGDSFTTALTLSDPSNGIWSFSEDSTGRLIASEYRENVRLWESTDDGASWSLLADDGDVQFSDHFHKVAFHPLDDDWIIATGGDGESSYARSTDGGSSWETVQLDGQVQASYVGFTFDLDDKNTLFFGTDGGRYIDGIYKVTDSGSGDATLDHAQSIGTAISESATGVSVYNLQTVSDGTDQFYIGGTSSNGTSGMVIASDESDGYRWRSVFAESFGAKTASQGHRSGVINPDDAPVIICGRTATGVRSLGNPMFGILHRQNYGPSETVYSEGEHQLTRVQNLDVGDGINYIDPSWPAQTDTYLQRLTGESLDGYSQSTTNSGSIGFLASDYHVDTGATDDSSATLIYRQRTSRVGTGRLDWGDKQIIHGMFNVLNADTGGELYLTWGEVHNGNAGFGVKSDGSDLFGVVHDGNSETTVDLNVDPTNSNRLKVIFDDGEIEYRINGSLNDTISSGLPSGGINTGKIFVFHVENADSGASQFDALANDYSVAAGGESSP